MIFLRKLPDGSIVYPYSEFDIRRDLGPRHLILNELADEDLTGLGVWPVEDVAPPAVSAGQALEAAEGADGVEEYAPGQWRQKWTIRNRTAAELAQAKEARKAEIRALRWQKEVGGATFNGLPIRTDEESRAKINGAVALFDKDPTLAVVDFEAQPGVWIEFDQPTMDALGVFVGRHVQQCFSHSKALMMLVDPAETFADLAAIDIEAGWPE